MKVLHRVASRIERSGGAGYAEDALLEDARQKMVASAVILANSLLGSKLIVFTRHGTMARYVSNMRPQHAPIFAFAPNDEICRQLALCWGTYAFRTTFTNDPNKTIEAAEEFLRDNKLAATGDELVIVSDLVAGETLVDCVQLRTVK